MSKNTAKEPATTSAPSITKNEFVENFYAARCAATPIVAVTTVDNYATVHKVTQRLMAETPMINFDVVRGWTPLNKAGEKAIAEALANAGVVMPAATGLSAMLAKPLPSQGGDIIDPKDCLKYARYLPKKRPGETGGSMPGAVLFMHNAHEYVGELAISQALLNLRDDFKVTQRCIVLLGPAFKLPPHLTQHVTILDEPLPTREEVALAVASFAREAGLELDGVARERATSTVLGLGAFSADQALAISSDMTSRKLNLDRLRTAKNQMITDTPGLEIIQNPRTFADIVGSEEIKKFGRAILNGRRSPEAIIIIDEGEKGFAGSDSSGDSGVARGMLGTMLTEMQNQRYGGIVAVGTPGVGKTMFGEAMGGEKGIPVILLKLREVMDSLVGSSEARLAHCLKTINAVSNGNAFFVMTSNNVSALPPELKARFTMGIWMFDENTAQGRRAMFEMYLNKKGIPELIPEIDQFDHDGWVGREIEACCEIAWRTGFSLKEAALLIRPVCKTDKERINAVRQQAHGNYNSAAYPGPYLIGGPQEEQATAGRALSQNV